MALRPKRATSITPQVVTLIIDDSASMVGDKSTHATGAIMDIVITLQSATIGATGSRFYVNIAKFGDEVTPLATAVPVLEVDLVSIHLDGSGGLADMPKALRWVAQAIQQALDRCRGLPAYNEDQAPNPICIFFSGGTNSSKDSIGAAVQAIKSIAFQGGGVDVIACGIGMAEAEFSAMREIASCSDWAFNIEPEDLAEFVAQTSPLDHPLPQYPEDEDLFPRFHLL